MYLLSILYNWIYTPVSDSFPGQNTLPNHILAIYIGKWPIYSPTRSRDFRRTLLYLDLSDLQLPMIFVCACYAGCLWFGFYLITIGYMTLPIKTQKSVHSHKSVLLILLPPTNGRTGKWCYETKDVWLTQSRANYIIGACLLFTLYLIIAILPLLRAPPPFPIPRH